ncbi:MAG TPA: tetratricopeptide repeat protein [Bryobacteraceae bacterium]|nr:tetratricopeptide repeat protein [Bryobacteraceae bacterium]
MRSATESSERDANNTAPPAAEISAESIRAALEKILASPGFATADRISRFLRYTVEETLNGQTDKLKESLLGIDVFGRKPSYDPRVDAVVRTEAVKLRARLREYYESEGREDEIVIDLPKGGYIPAFRHREKQLPEPAPPVAAEPNHVRRWQPALATILVVAILATSIYFFSRARTRAAASGSELASIAVLPFADLSPDKDQEYFCDGMTEEIIDALAKVNGFRVVARTSSFAFKGKQQDIREIGKKLNVATVLEGSVRKDGNRLRVTAQLNSVADGYHLWSETYERELKDVFTVQDEISRAIVDTLQLKLANAGRKLRPSSANVEAYDLYLQGRYHWSRWRSEGAERSIEYFQQAIRKDPNYAAAYSGLADSYAWLGFFGALNPNEAMPKARQAALKALALDDSLAAAHTSLGYVKSLHEFDWSGAEREFKRALQLNSGDSDAHFGYGITYLAPMGRLEEAVHEMQTARELDPLSPIANTYLGLAYHFVGNRTESAMQLRKALELDPGFVEARLELANLSIDDKNFSEFNSQLDLAKELAPQSRIDLMRALVYAIEGKKIEALQLVHKWEKPASGAFVRSTSIASVFAILGDKAQMYAWLERAYADRDGMLAFVNLQGVYRPYRSEPRFIALEKKLGFN